MRSFLIEIAFLDHSYVRVIFPNIYFQNIWSFMVIKFEYWLADR